MFGLTTSRSDGIATVWLLSTLNRSVSKQKIQQLQIGELCKEIEKIEPRALRVSSNLMFGVAVVYRKKVEFCHRDVTQFRVQLMHEKQAPRLLEEKPRQQLLQDDPNFAIDLIDLQELNLDAEDVVHASFFFSQDSELEQLRRARRMTTTSSVEADVSSVPLNDVDFEMQLDLDLGPVNEELNFSFDNNLTMEMQEAHVEYPAEFHAEDPAGVSKRGGESRKRRALRYDEEINLPQEEMRHARDNYVEIMVELAQGKASKRHKVHDLVATELHEIPTFNFLSSLLTDTTVSSVERARRVRRESQSSTNTDTLHLDMLNEQEYSFYNQPNFDLHTLPGSSSTSRSSSRPPRGRYSTIEEPIDEDPATQSEQLFAHIQTLPSPFTLNTLLAGSSRKAAAVTFSEVLSLSSKRLVKLNQPVSRELGLASSIIVTVAAQF